MAQAERLGVVAGELPVRGPGLRFTIDDAPGRQDAVGADPRAGDAAAGGVVLDSDLQIVVNGLWAAGAEAVAVNGQRLTGALGDPVGRAGDPRRLPAAGAAVRRRRDRRPGEAADRFRGRHAPAPTCSRWPTTAASGDEATREALSLPAAGRLVLREAKPVPDSLAASPTASNSNGGHRAATPPEVP